MNDLINRLREGVFGSDEAKTDDVIQAYMHRAADRIEQLEATCKDHGEIQKALCDQLTEAKKLIEQLAEALEYADNNKQCPLVAKYCDGIVHKALAAAKQFRGRNV